MLVSEAKLVILTTRNNHPHVRFSSAESTSYPSPNDPSDPEATLQEQPGGGGINTPRTYVGVPVQALTPITPTHPPAQVFEGIVDLDPRVTVIPV